MKHSLVMLALFAGMGACSTDEIEVYKTGRYVYFTDMPTDSIKESFFFYPDAETIDVDLYVRYAGREVESDINYQLVVDEELTTAQAGIDYEVDLEPVMSKGQEVDTLRVVLKKTAELDTKDLQLVLRLVENENFQVGPLDSLQSPRIVFTSQSARPTWWDDEIEEFFLGTYSDEKYQLFITVTGISDMSELSIAEKRIYSLRLKNYLIEQSNNGNPVMDGNVEMSVPVL